jgi:hypothetical protein
MCLILSLVVSYLQRGQANRICLRKCIRLTERHGSHCCGRLLNEKAFLLQILSGASGLLGSCATCLFRASLLKDRPFPPDYHHYGDTAWTYQNLSESILAFYLDPVAQFKIHEREAPRIVDKD